MNGRSLGGGRINMPRKPRGSLARLPAGPHLTWPELSHVFLHRAVSAPTVSQSPSAINFGHGAVRGIETVYCMYIVRILCIYCVGRGIKTVSSRMVVLERCKTAHSECDATRNKHRVKGKVREMDRLDGDGCPFDAASLSTEYIESTSSRLTCTST